MKTSLIIIFLSIIILVGCKSAIDSKKFGSGATASISRVKLLQDVKEDENKKKTYSVSPNILWSQFDATKRSSLISVLPKSSDIEVRVLAENSPDLALEAVNKITANLKNDKIEIGAALEFSRNIAQIKRSASVENFRNLSYRISESVGNDGKIDKELSELYAKLIEAAKSNNEKEIESTIKEVEKDEKLADAELQKQKNIAEMLNQLKDSKTDSITKVFLKTTILNMSK